MVNSVFSSNTNILYLPLTERQDKKIQRVILYITTNLIIKIIN